MVKLSISDAATRYLNNLQAHRTINTYRSYANAVDAFLSMLKSQQLDVSTYPVAKLSEDSIVNFVIYTKKLSPSTESLYLQVIKNLFEYLSAEKLVEINISRVRNLIRRRTRRVKLDISINYPEDHIIQFIEKMAAISMRHVPNHNKEEVVLLRDLRDSALVLTLADTGIRVDEVCRIKIGDIEWSAKRAIIAGRGKKQSSIRFSTRSLKSIKKYLDFRRTIDDKTGRKLPTLPVFARHDKGVGKKIKPVTTTTIRNIIRERVNEVLGSDTVGIITPHTFLHYFVTTILRSSGNLKLAQKLARHSNIQVTQRYAHLSDDELDKGYYEIFEKNVDDQP